MKTNAPSVNYDELNHREINAIFFGLSHGATPRQLDGVLDRIEGDPTGVKSLVKRLVASGRKKNLIFE